MARRRRWPWVVGGLLLLGAALVGWEAYPKGGAARWGPLTGRIIDGETGRPISGAVVLATWDEIERWNPVHPRSLFYDAQEAVTDADGRFTIPGIRPLWGFRVVRQPNWRVFAPGYTFGRWVVTPPTGEVLVDPTVIEMRAAKTREERLDVLRRADGAAGSLPPEKRCLLTRAINQEWKNLGLEGADPECAQ